MSSTGIADGRFGMPNDGGRPVRISAYADYRPLYPRTQSLTFRNTPWGTRMKPLRTWNELGTYAIAASVAGAALIFALT